MRKLFVAFGILLVFLVQVSAAELPTPTPTSYSRPPPYTALSNCAYISSPGNYKVVNNIDFRAGIGYPVACFIIDADNVVLDCDNRELRCIEDPFDASGVWIGWSRVLNNVVVKNCRIKNTFEAIAVFANNVELKNNVLTDNYHGIAVGDYYGNVQLDNVKLEANVISGNYIPEISGHGCPVIISPAVSASLGNNYVCKNIYPACFYGSTVFYCDSRSTVSDLGRNTVDRSKTNCPINPRTCPPSPTAVAVDNGRNLPVKPFKASNSVVAAPPEQNQDLLTYGIAGPVGLLIVVGALVWYFKCHKK